MIYAQSIIEEHSVINEFNIILENILLEETEKEQIEKIKEEFKEFTKLYNKIREEHKVAATVSDILSCIGMGIAILSWISMIKGQLLSSVIKSVTFMLLAIISRQVSKGINKEYDEEFKKYEEKIKTIRAKNKNKEVDKELEKIQNTLAYG